MSRDVVSSGAVPPVASGGSNSLGTNGAHGLFDRARLHCRDGWLMARASRSIRVRHLDATRGSGAGTRLEGRSGKLSLDRTRRDESRLSPDVRVGSGRRCGMAGNATSNDLDANSNRGLILDLESIPARVIGGPSTILGCGTAASVSRVR